MLRRNHREGAHWRERRRNWHSRARCQATTVNTAPGAAAAAAAELRAALGRAGGEEEKVPGLSGDGRPMSETGGDAACRGGRSERRPQPRR